MKKKTLTLIMLITAVTVMALCSCAGKETKETEDAPEVHAIAYDESMATLKDEGGADLFDHSLDHADSKYYVIHDFYNMKSDETLHILPHFETYQQTTEYSEVIGSSCFGKSESENMRTRRKTK